MFKMSEYSFVAGTIAVGLALACYVLAFIAVRIARARTGLVAAGVGGETVVVNGSGMAGLAAYGSLITSLALAFLTMSLMFRTIASGHGPFVNMYEFAIAFAWGVVAVYVYFEHRYHQRMLSVLVLPVALGLLIYATMQPADIEPLVPALQNNLLLTIHVAVAIIAYGTFAIAFASAVLYLIQPDGGIPGLPKPEVLDSIAHRAVVIGFPFLTLTIVFGALWANIAWGSYWSWDPKETASLVTWLLFGSYLHARVVRGWRGRRAAWLLVIGFAAAIFTFFGNLFFGGLHSYATGGGN